MCRNELVETLVVCAYGLGVSRSLKSLASSESPRSDGAVVMVSWLQSHRYHFRRIVHFKSSQSSLSDVVQAVLTCSSSTGNGVIAGLRAFLAWELSSSIFALGL